MTMNSEKYKDAPPEITIQRIRDCLFNIGINLSYEVKMRMENIYSSVVDGQQLEKEPQRSFV